MPHRARCRAHPSPAPRSPTAGARTVLRPAPRLEGPREPREVGGREPLRARTGIDARTIEGAAKRRVVEAAARRERAERVPEGLPPLPEGGAHDGAVDVEV